MPKLSSGGRLPLHESRFQSAGVIAIATGPLLPRHDPSRHPRGFALVELLVVLAIIGTLSGLLLSAVSHVREAGRKLQCSNNLKQMSLGVCAYEASRRTFPPGVDAIAAGPSLPFGTQHAWSSFILPQIEEQAIASSINYRTLWNALGGNADAASHSIPLYICPSGSVFFPGKQDYGGISGTHIVPTGQQWPAANPSFNGIIIAATSAGLWGVSPSQVIDGLSRTLLIGEAVDRGSPVGTDTSGIENLVWAWGTNTFAQNATFINSTTGQGLRSHHVGGAYGSFADGRCTFLDETMDPDVLAAICTRDGGESKASDTN